MMNRFQRFTSRAIDAFNTILHVPIAVLLGKIGRGAV